MNTLVPVTLLKTIKIMDSEIDVCNDWMVCQTFKLENGKVISVVGFGRTKDEALMDFEAELQYEITSIGY